MNTEFWQLRAAARNYFDSHQHTTQLTNRIKALARQGHAEPVLDMQLEIAEDARRKIGRELTRLYEQLAPPAIVKFQKETPGLGELYMAQLVGILGDFRTYTEAWWEDSSPGSTDSQLPGDEFPDSLLPPDDEDYSRQTSDSQCPQEKRILVTGATLTCGVRDIWSYCGHGDASRRRKKGMTQEDAFAAGSPLAKSIVHMMADFSVRLNGVPDKNGRARAMSPYYPHFIAWKEEAAAAHPKWTKLHVHNHALRKVGKAILKDIWRVQHGFEPAWGDRTPWTPRQDPQPMAS